MHDLDFAIDLSATNALHRALIDGVSSDARPFRAAVATASDRLEQHGIRFGGTRRVDVKLSALLLTSTEWAAIGRTVELLHSLIERALDWLLADTTRVRHFFPDHDRFLPYLVKTRGLAFWQGYSRYDVIVAPEGKLLVTELNTCCAAGLLGGSTTISEITRDALVQLSVDTSFSLDRVGA